MVVQPDGRYQEHILHQNNQIYEQEQHKEQHLVLQGSWEAHDDEFCVGVRGVVPLSHICSLLFLLPRQPIGKLCEKAMGEMWQETTIQTP